MLNGGTDCVVEIALRLTSCPVSRKEKDCSSLVLLFSCFIECTLAVAYTPLIQLFFDLKLVLFYMGLWLTTFSVKQCLFHKSVRNFVIFDLLHPHTYIPMLILTPTGSHSPSTKDTGGSTLVQTSEWQIFILRSLCIDDSNLSLISI